MSVSKHLPTQAWTIRADPITGLRLFGMRGLGAHPTSGTRLANIHHVSLQSSASSSSSHVPLILIESADTDPPTRYALNITHLNRKTREDGSGFPGPLKQQLKACEKQNRHKSDTEKQIVLAGVLCVCLCACARSHSVVHDHTLCPCVCVSVSSVHVCPCCARAVYLGSHLIRFVLVSVGRCSITCVLCCSSPSQVVQRQAHLRAQCDPGRSFTRQGVSGENIWT